MPRRIGGEKGGGGRACLGGGRGVSTRKGRHGVGGKVYGHAHAASPWTIVVVVVERGGGGGGVNLGGEIRGKVDEKSGRLVPSST